MLRLPDLRFPFPPSHGEVTESFWGSLRYFNFYRGAAAAVFPLVSLAGAALVSRGTLMLFYAALASIAVLLEQAYWVLVFDAGTATFLQPGLLSIGYFATALITNRLARRLIMNERVARQRGADPA